MTRRCANTGSSASDAKLSSCPPASATSPRPSKGAARCVALPSLTTKCSTYITVNRAAKGEGVAIATSLLYTCIVTSRYIAGKLDQPSPQMRDCNRETA